MKNIVEAKNLSKSYFKKKALDNLNLTIPEGQVLGLLGPNGSGKTTFIKILSGILSQSSGDIIIDGNIPGAYTKSVVSYLPDKNYLYKWMTVNDAILFFKDFYSDFDEVKAYELLSFMKLDKNSKVTSLSKGMSEKLNLTLVLSRKAKLYVLDEPIAGVDPVAREKILDAIINNYNKDSSMIITTHLVRDIERIFDHVSFISEGKIILSGNAEELREEKGRSIDELYRDVFGEQ
ncbi:ABC transporter ATP-binding protein [Clostridium algidicarnis]|uniref:ABC transporter ATP-binding protein n=1 Tax=Clostridium algidicarnis TaxID=37659 RepID=UPI0016264DC9|nr:ABC transporter ATP-binding protein [Clostridium algidicarnis]MBB6696480.1 ABC transporter ATP-binding protein [Clostridium algidicarnis]MBU3195898.1 ABC transporter ATP-binding protein [Clostridium algidicarnis]MBU3202891.1 ABC transporter ATP-binding protein [Clostridium algidicarnis]MBU3205807.1 ABC transporter ATP-binding protein [Clostridium algidicarnis]MBU3208924.1 ABC transporter ATP-binding protein [Clostridium algidicarnis]